MALSTAHWVYLTGVVVIIAVMIMKKNVVVPAVAATFLTAWVYTGSFVTGLSSVFNASLTAASELFSIFLIIALITALLGALRALGADQRMVKPFQGVMRNGTLAFVVIALVTYVISLFFWPTPAIPLIAAILLPAAIRAGLPPMGAAMAMAIAGQGMALSSDYIIQVAPGLSAKAASVQAGEVADQAMILSLVTGVVALLVAFLRVRTRIVAPDPQHLRRWEEASEESAAATHQNGGQEPVRVGGDTVSGPGALRMPSGSDTVRGTRAVRRSKAFAVLVPAAFATLVGYTILGKFATGVPEIEGDGAALVGGTAALLLLVATVTLDGLGSLESCASHVVDGLVFAFKAMGVVIPIAGFFFIGNEEFAGEIIGLSADATAPSFLIELVSAAQGALPDNALVLYFGLLLVGMATGLDGSGFSGLPLTGSLSGALGPAAGVDPATLAAIGQMGSIWTGGGALIAWSSLIAVAAFTRVSVIELTRRCFLPVMAGLVVSTAFAPLVH